MIFSGHFYNLFIYAGAECYDNGMTMMSITQPCNGIAEIDLESVETIKMKGVLYPEKINVEIKLLSGGTNMPVSEILRLTGL
jgi:hypothetical protein